MYNYVRGYGPVRIDWEYFFSVWLSHVYHHCISYCVSERLLIKVSQLCTCYMYAKTRWLDWPCPINEKVVILEGIWCLLMHPVGPDGIADYKVQIKDPKYIGHGTMSPEGTGDVQYLCRAAKVSCSYRLSYCVDTIFQYKLWNVNVLWLFVNNYSYKRAMLTVTGVVSAILFRLKSEQNCSIYLKLFKFRMCMLNSCSSHWDKETVIFLQYDWQNGVPQIWLWAYYGYKCVFEHRC